MDEYIGSNWNPVLPISTDATFSSETTVLGTSVSYHLTWGAIVLSVIMGAISVVTIKISVSQAIISFFRWQYQIW
ncbi:unnamed protein product [Brugia pahangi]|uniref:COX2_TM domain-containing protein n=1 Tax=Brugia pahangi TaxID=6280 RepID=A0A0N4SXX6_BRUPA|nr:unnamed protein product [Brugia pahangi]